ncbi:MAG: ABC transporter permease [Desulfurococcaceae archaeon]
MSEPLINIAIRSVWISSIAAFSAFITAVFICFYLTSIRGKAVDIALGVFEAMVGIPTTLIGLLVYMLIYPGGPLGPLRLLYTPIAIIIGEFLVVLPMAVTYMFKHFHGVRENVRELVLSLGVTEERARWLVVRELLPIAISTYMVSFSRAIGELGVALIVGGGIEGRTNVFTTAIALQTSIGNYEAAIYTGLVLLALTLCITVSTKLLGERFWK